MLISLYNYNKVKHAYTDPRSVVAAFLRSNDDSSIIKATGYSPFDLFSFIAYEAIDYDSAFTDTFQLRHFLDDNAFYAPKNLLTTKDKLEHHINLMVTYIKNGLSNTGDIKDRVDFPSDGVIIRLFDYANKNKYIAGNRYPKDIVAFKFEYELPKVSIVNNIEYTTGKTGRITPVVYFEPVIINGKTIKKASLYSEKTLQESGIIIGDIVEVFLQGKVIPKIRKIKLNT